MKQAGGESRPEGTRPYRMQARREAVERNREAIMEATFDLWLEQPYDEITVEAVAEAAGVSRQTVHRQFGTKEELVVAVAEWVGPRIEAARDVEPGDVEGAVERLVGSYETMGDANVRALELEGRVAEIDGMLARGRASHRGWLGRVFAPRLPPPGRQRDRAVDALYAATDVMVWKLLRRDLGRSRQETQATILRLVRGVLGTLDGQARKAHR